MKSSQVIRTLGNKWILGFGMSTSETNQELLPVKLTAHPCNLKGNLSSKSRLSRLGQFHRILPSIIRVVTTPPRQLANSLVIKPRRSSLVHDPPSRARTKLRARCFPATEDCLPLLLPKKHRNLGFSENYGCNLIHNMF